MPQTPHPDNSRRRLLGVAVKLMAYGLLTTIVLVMVLPLLPKHSASPIEPLRLNVAKLLPGQSQGIEWNRRRLLVVRPGEEQHYLAILDYDPLYGCPLRWVAAGDASAPLVPWPGGYRAICTDHWYNRQGKALSEGVADLKPVPFTVETPATLLFTQTR